jgi:hypothetical protein
VSPVPAVQTQTGGGGKLGSPTLEAAMMMSRFTAGAGADATAAAGGARSASSTAS